MTHIPNCGFWNPDCPRCSTMTVGDLDDSHFRELMGCTRPEFERMCLNWKSSPVKNFYNLPYGLYNFWYPIMEANALKVYFGAASLAGLQNV